PKLHAIYTSLDGKIVKASNPEIKCSFPHSCYPASSHFNMHKSGTLYHSNFWNWLFSMCAIFSGGKFDHKSGGHFIAWDLSIVAEFPPGSAIYVSSAAVPHTNSSIVPHERHHSMVFFLPAGLVHYYHNGFLSDK
ncbi:hypothetical protein BDP27DRAFT_1229077, partial [Rhodocollybia butyracea]